MVQPSSNSDFADLLDRGALDEVENLCRQALHDNAADARALFFLGVVEARRGKLDAAKSRFYSVLKIDPSRPEVYVNLALILRSQGRNSEALQLCSRVLAVEPANSVARRLMLSLLGSTDVSERGRPAQVIRPMSQDIGVARNVKRSAQPHGGKPGGMTVLQMTLDYFGSGGELVDSRFIELRGLSILGEIREGDFVRVLDSPDKYGRIKKAMNVTLGVVVKRSLWGSLK